MRTAPSRASRELARLAACLAAMGIRQFYEQPPCWRGTALITGLSLAGLTFFVVGIDSMPIRMFVYSLGQSCRWR
ncbi:MAG TPA: hypothetical protein VII41_08005 [Steroidobacteraceae bacterium]